MSDRADSPSHESQRHDEDKELRQGSPAPDHAGDDSDSELSEADENLFADEDIDEEIREVNAAAQRVILDEDTVKQLGVHRRAVVDRTREPVPASRNRGRGKRRRNVEEEEEAEGVTIENDERVRKTRVRSRTPEEDLPEEERLKRQLDRKIDEALKSGKSKRRKKRNDDSIETYHDELLVDMRKKMRQAAEEDQEANKNGQPAISKLKLLPDLRVILGNPSIANNALDNSILEEIRSWLEPLQATNALPAYEIQRELFKWLESIHPNTDILRESGIGKIVLFYTKDIRPQAHIKRSAENLVREWSRPILGKSADYKTKKYKEAEYDPDEVHLGGISQAPEEKPDALAPPARNPNRTRVPMSMANSYEIAPKSMVSSSANRQLPKSNGDDFMKRIKGKQIAERKAKRSTMKFS